MNTQNNRTIYVGNLPQVVTDQLLIKIFGNFGQCMSCHIMRDLSFMTCPYAFIEYSNHPSASLALAAMDGIYMWDQQIKVNWANVAGNNQSHAAIPAAKVDLANATQIFVGDIGLDVDEAMLKEGFAQFGNLLDTKVVRYPDGQSRGFAFVAYSTKVEGQKAIDSMNKTWFHNRSIKCNWATRNGSDAEQFVRYVPRPYELVFKEAPLTNTNVYVAGEELTEDSLMCHFQEFGRIDYIKVNAEKGHAFINFVTHEAAARAISQRHGYKLNDNVIKCNWGKDNFSAGNILTPVQPTLPMSTFNMMGGQQNYNMPPQYPVYPQYTNY